jgi:hypothetical protein
MIKPRPVVSALSGVLKKTKHHVLVMGVFWHLYVPYNNCCTEFDQRQWCIIPSVFNMTPWISDVQQDHFIKRNMNRMYFSPFVNPLPEHLFNWFHQCQGCKYSILNHTSEVLNYFCAMKTVCQHYLFPYLCRNLRETCICGVLWCLCAVSVFVLQDNSDDIMLCSVKAVYSCVCGGLCRWDACICGVLCNNVMCMYIICLCKLFVFVSYLSL